ncbi:MAG TPA: hypothetical protein VK932_30145 [Kofleriaceae bacterium]|nr:hypothetical protein [Kofleriaceae bacterium]
MRLSALLALALALALPLAGCTLYFGSGDPGGTDDPAPPGPTPPDPSPTPSPTEPPPLGCGTPEVHVVGIYETSSNHSTVGEARVAIERPGRHILVLSAYEATRWKIRLGANTRIREVRLLGYEPQTVDLPNVPVTRGPGCGYSYPYNGGGCDTDALLAGVKAHTGRDVTTFHGCYQASQWTLHADGTASSNCNTAAGYEVDELIASCDGPGDWEAHDFPTVTPASCTGPRFVRRHEGYGMWIGAIGCGAPDRYKLYMAATRTEPFLEIADFAGHGQDHCELVNPQFTMPDEDDITSGGCTSCALGELVDIDGVPVYARANFGEPFQRVQARYWADLTTTFYSCGVAIP